MTNFKIFLAEKIRANDWNSAREDDESIIVPGDPYEAQVFIVRLGPYELPEDMVEKKVVQNANGHQPEVATLWGKTKKKCLKAFVQLLPVSYKQRIILLG